MKWIFLLMSLNLHSRLNPNEVFLIKRLVAFFATGDTIVGNNLVLNLYRHINSPEARMYLGRQLYEEMLHVQFYLTLLDTYISDGNERAKAFSAINDIPSIKKKADFSFQVDGLCLCYGANQKQRRQKTLSLGI